MIAQAGHFRFYYSAFTVQTQLFYIAKTALSHCKISFFQLKKVIEKICLAMF